MSSARLGVLIATTDPAFAAVGDKFVVAASSAPPHARANPSPSATLPQPDPPNAPTRSIPIVSMTPEYNAALDALARAADAMTKACNDYNRILAQTPPAPPNELAALKQTCEQTRDAHDEALADAWELIEQQPPTS